MHNNTAKPAAGKHSSADKPYPDFPLSVHSHTGRYCKKINGVRHYFGKIADGWQAALAEYDRVKDDLYAGRQPRPKTDGLVTRDLLNRYRAAQERRCQAGEIAERTCDAYRRVCDEVYAYFGGNRVVLDLMPEDFGKWRMKLARRLGPVGLGNVIRMTKGIFTWAYKNGLLDRPMRYGDQFNRPSARTMRQHRALQGPRVYEDAAVIRRMLRLAGVNLKAAILLAVNGGLSNKDIALLPQSAVDFGRQWLSYPRTKTWVPREIPLWDETVQALREVLAHRRPPRDPAHEPFVFVNKFGQLYVRGVATDGIGQEFRKLQDKVGDDHDFYSLRHRFKTIAKIKTGDGEIVEAIMGHAPDENDVSAVYDHSLEMESFRADIDARRWRAVNAVREWLFKDADKDDLTDEEVSQ